MEAAQVEVVTQFRFRLAPQAQNGALPHLVAERLSPHVGRIAQGLGRDLGLGVEDVVAHVLAALFQRPAEQVHSRVDDEPGGDEDLHHVGPVLAQGIVGEEARVDAQEGRVHAPPLRVRRVHAVAPHRREGVVGVLARDVEVVAGEELVKRNPRVGEPAALVEVGAVEVVVADRVVRCGRVVVPEGLGALQGRIEAPGTEGRVGLGEKELVRALEEAPRRRIEAFPHLLHRPGEVVRVGGNVAPEVVDRALEADAGLDGEHLFLDLGHVLQADLVDLLRGDVHRGVGAHQVAVRRFTPGLARQPDLGRGGLAVFAIEEGGEALQRGVDLVGDDAFGLGEERRGVTRVGIRVLSRVLTGVGTRAWISALTRARIPALSPEARFRHREGTGRKRGDTRTNDPHHGVHVGLGHGDAPFHLAACMGLDERDRVGDLGEEREVDVAARFIGHRHHAEELAHGPDRR